VKPSGGCIGVTKTESKERERERDVSKGIRYGLVKRKKETKEKRKMPFAFNRCERERTLT